MKAGQYFALTVGIIYLAIGIMGFIPGFVSAPDSIPSYVSVTGVESGYGYLLGLFPVNTVHNLIHLTVGGVGIAASISWDTSRWYSGLLGVFYGVLTVMGLIPYMNTTFGLAPIFGNDVWLHAVTAAIAVYFGFIAMPDVQQLLIKEEAAASSE
jgi:hypothetical protein